MCVKKNKNISISTNEEPTKETLSESLLRYDRDLAGTAKLLRDFNQFVQDAQTSLKSTKVGYNSAQTFETNSFGVESNLGKNFDDLSKVNLRFKKLSKSLSEWSKFIATQSSKQQEYAESSLINETDLEQINGRNLR